MLTPRCARELEICGYGCLDHYLENDLYEASLECLAKIIRESPEDMLLDIGLPIKFRDVRYNCRAIVYNKRLVLIRPKISLANDGNYREMRYFSEWRLKGKTRNFILPKILRDIAGQIECPIGDAVIDTLDTCLAPECCEELFTPASPHIESGLNGASIFFNSSGSHHELRKLDSRIQLLLEATRKSKGVYIYANQQGCDGDRLYYDGCAMVMMNGAILAQSSQFSLSDVEVITAVVDLDEVSSARSAPSTGSQAAQALAVPYERILIQVSLHEETTIVDPMNGPTLPLARPRYHSPWEEIAMGPGCYLWDYLRRSRAAGYLVPLSGGIDSCATAVIVFSMCRLVAQAIKDGNQQVIEDCQRITTQEHNWVLSANAEDICNKILHTAFLGMEKQSSPDTRARAKELAERMGSHHTSCDIDLVFNALTAFFTTVMNWTLKFKVHGGDNTENLALQNIQARLRMVISYLFAQTLPTTRKREGGGSLLVLGSANVVRTFQGLLLLCPRS